jgi:pyruvate dehydrogenase E1 component
MIPVFLYYSMFGFQRVGDLIWAAGDSRSKGFLIGGTSGRTTLNGEGLQHQDGHSHLFSAAYPTVRSYDPAFAYEVIVLALEGLRRMYAEGEQVIYYLTLGNENRQMPEMPADAEEGICRGLYRFRTVEAENGEDAPRAELFGSGMILHEALRAQEILAERYGVSSSVYSATSYTELAREASAAERFARLHPGEDAPQTHLDSIVQGLQGPVIAASDWVRAVPEQINRWIPGGMTVLGTDGFGRSDSRPALRRFFEVDAEHIAYAALWRLAERGDFDSDRLGPAIEDLELDPDAPAPWTV